MRANLRRLNMRWATYSARYVHSGWKGNVLLRDVTGPEGVTVDHLWVRGEHWHGIPHESGDSVTFRARAEPYFRDDGTKDWSLFCCSERWP